MEDGGGTLTIRTEVVDPPPAVVGQRPELADTRCVHLEVSDTGGGITPQMADRIFEPYFTTKGMGSGLGLATVFGVVEDGGGVIDVQSVQGSGTTFHVYLPVTDAAPAPRVGEHDSEREPASWRSSTFTV